MATTPAPVLELATLRITVSQEEALAKQTAPINNTLRKAPGFRHITWGFQDEDPTVLIWLIGRLSMVCGADCLSGWTGWVGG